MKQALALALSLALAGAMWAAEPPQDTAAAKSKKTKAPSVASQLSELKEAIDAQQKQIQDLGQQLQTRDQQIQQLQQRLDQSQAAASQAQAKADAAAAQASQDDQNVTALKGDVSDLKLNSSNMAQSLQETQKNFHDQLESPFAVHFKGITITPGGYMAAETVYRNRALGADIVTPFNSVNMPGAGQNGLSEFYGSGRASRVSMLVEGKAKDVKLSGYWEADFLSSAVTSSNNNSNSYSLRQRQAWGQVASGGWSLTGGQMWSLITETKNGMDNRTEAPPLTVDISYNVGFSYARQYGVRLVRNFNNHFWLGASLENPQTTFASRNNAANFAFGSAGNGGGGYNSAITACSSSVTTTTVTGVTPPVVTGVTTTCTNAANYSFNATPDFIFKAVAQGGIGHFEVFGILSRYRDRVYPCAENPAAGNCGGSSTLGVYNDSQSSGGFGANGRITLAKQFDIGAHFLTGLGVGRYGTGGLPDATVNPDGTLALIRSYQALGTLEWHTKRLDLYTNAGEEYAGRRWSYDPNNTTNPLTPVGYGSPLFNVAGCYTETAPSLATGFGFGGLKSCSADTQRLVEGTVGFWIKVHQGPHGRLQFGPQYSYLVRDAWTGTNAKVASGFSAPHGIDNMFFTSFRYYLP